MDRIARDIYRAIHTGAWLKVEYLNREQETTRYWIGIRKLNAGSRILTVDGLNVATRQMTELTLRYDAIQSTEIVYGTYYETNPALIRDIREHPARYADIFTDTTNLKILDYYIDCNRLDVSPERVKWSLIEELDIETLGRGPYHLSPDQYAAIIKKYNLRRASKRAEANGWMISLCMNVASLHVKGGLCVLAYREVLLDVANRTLRQSPDVTLCSEFTVDGEQYNIDRFLSEEHRHLLRDFEANEEEIKAVLDLENPEYGGVDDMPYLMAIARSFTMGLEKDYAAILQMMGDGSAPTPIRAFFGALTQKPRSLKPLPLAFFSSNLNVDQLNALYSGIRSPLLYVQGPPGTGKTNTILNMVISLFFNNRTVLISSYNNHPMDEIFQKLQTLTADDTPIPFPVVRLGNNEKVQASIRQIRHSYQLALSAPEDLVGSVMFPKNEREDMQKLARLLKRHEKRQEELERRDMLQTTISSSGNMLLLADMQGRQLKKLQRRLHSHKAITEEELSEFTGRDNAELMRLIMAASVHRLRMLERPKYRELYNLLFDEALSPEKAALLLNEYLSLEENMRGFLKLFPVVITTNSSAYKLGPPKPLFDMTIIDEASQCSTATSLLAVLRSRQLMLVGDPQQLKPVVQLDPAANERLRQKYHVPAEYDYVGHSAYETFLAVDAVSDEILLRYHYRCHPKIITFNNRKYYNSRLEIRSKETSDQPLQFIDCRAFGFPRKNTCESEVLQIIEYIRQHPDEQIGVITPFSNQRELIRQAFRAEGIQGVSNGTVHAFQGDERQVILFSLALSAKTGIGTYGWLRNNRELINVATSRAREKLVLIGDARQLRRLHSQAEGMGSAGGSGRDDIFELYEYICSNGTSAVSEIAPTSRALGIKPYEQEAEDELLCNLNHAMQALPLSTDRCEIRHREQAVDVLLQAIYAQAFAGTGKNAAGAGAENAGAGAEEDGVGMAATGETGAGAENAGAGMAATGETGAGAEKAGAGMTATGETGAGAEKAGAGMTATGETGAGAEAPFGSYRPGQMRALARDLYHQKTFDYVVYERDGQTSIPIFAIDLEGLDFDRDEVTIQRRQRFLDLLNFQCISIPSSYARRYQYLKEILTDYFEWRR